MLDVGKVCLAVQLKDFLQIRLKGSVYLGIGNLNHSDDANLCLTDLKTNHFYSERRTTILGAFHMCSRFNCESYNGDIFYPFFFLKYLFTNKTC